MAKISLGKRPKSFKRVIKVPMVEGGFAAVEVAFIYRTRTEFGQFVDVVMKAAQVVPASASDDDVEFSLRDALERTRDTNADYILQIVEGWDLDEPFSRAAVIQLCDELPGAAQAIIAEYRAAITEGRLGN